MGDVHTLDRTPARIRSVPVRASAAELVNLVEERIRRRLLAASAAPPSAEELATLPPVVRVTGAAMVSGRAPLNALVEAAGADRRVLTGGTCAEIEAWLRARDYVHVQGSRGFWQRPLLGPGGAA